MFWVIVGVVVALIVWAIVAASSRKVEMHTDSMTPVTMPSFDPPERELPKAKHWQEAKTASVSKNFGRGGPPTGISKDSGSQEKKLDDDMERLRKAKPFEPRAILSDLNLDEK
jgi:hypothetical protein